jgi:hypothetical protein
MIKTIVEERGEEIFSHLQILKQEHHEARKRMYHEHPQLQRYIETFESPAINFANIIMRETVEPDFVGRITDYSDSEKKSVPKPYDPDALINQIFFANIRILNAGGVEPALNQSTESFQQNLAAKTPGALVRLQDTPKAQIEAAQLQGKMAGQSQHQYR